jgi:Amt family ammonium transporter
MPDIALPLVLTLLIPFALVGLALINTGLTRSRSAAHSMLSGLCAAAMAVLAFVVLGSALVGAPGQPAHWLQIGGKAWGWMGNGQLFSRGFHASDPNGLLLLIFQLFAVSLTVQIPVAAGAERWRLTAICLSTALLAGLLVPLVSFWIWRGGFLSQMGVMDAGGAGVVNVTGGLTALVMAWLLGARQNKFSAEGAAAAIPGHNAVMVLAGSLLALVGWIGLTCGGALLFYHAEAGALLLALINTLVAASGAAVSALLTAKTRFGKPDASLIANGWVCGLVAVSAGAPFFRIPEALLVGLVAGVIVVFSIEGLETWMHIDDPAGAISVHAVGGMWGLMAAGLFTLGGAPGQLLAQFIAVGSLAGFVIPAAYGANYLINRLVPHRVAAAGERQGMDLFELGTGAYPEFLTRSDDLQRR